MPNCVICKKSVTTGFALCGHCAKELEPYTLPPDLAWFMSYLADEIVHNDEIPACALCALRSCSGRVNQTVCRNGVKAWLLSRAKEAFFATTGAKSQRDFFERRLLMENKMIPAIRIGFINPETGNLDETEFDTDNHTEAMCLFQGFCMENNFAAPEILYADACWSRK